MEYKLYREEDFKTSQRIDGRTQELVLDPESSTYLERNFIWRLSLDFIEKEEANLSRLPDYDRILMVVEGEVVLSHEEQRVTRLKELDVYKRQDYGI